MKGVNGGLELHKNGSTCSVGFNNCLGCRELLRSRHSLISAYERLPVLDPAFTHFPIWGRQVHILPFLWRSLS